MPSRRPLVALAALAVVSIAISTVAAPAAPPRVTKADPRHPDTARFTNYSAPLESGLGQNALEPSIGVNHRTNRVMFLNGLETLQVTFDDSVRPPQAAYRDVSFPVTGTETLDPLLYTDAVTGRTFVSQLLPPCSITAYTDTDGDPPVPDAPVSTAWRQSTGCGAFANFDHQQLVSGPGRSREASPVYGPGRLVYYCSQIIAEAGCAVSRDGGITFAQARPAYTIYAAGSGPVPGLQGCRGLHGHIAFGPDGTVYLPNFECSDVTGTVLRAAVVVSEDEGLTWQIRQIPDGPSGNFDSDPSAAVDAGGRLYVVYESDTSNAMVATSDDQGRTWTKSVDIGAAFGIKNSVFHDAIAGSKGRAALAFLGTPAEAPLNSRKVPENQLAAFEPKGGWHLYVAFTYDGGATWTTQDVTPTDPVQRGCIWWGGARGTSAGNPACPSSKRNLLDFMDMSVDRVGRVVVGYADGCVAECVKDPSEPSRSAVGVIARQFCGRGLYATFDEHPLGPYESCARARPTSRRDPLAAPPPPRRGGP